MRTEEIHSDDICIGDLIWDSGYLWIVDTIRREVSFRPGERRTVLIAHWSGIGKHRPPAAFIDRIDLAHIDSITWLRARV